MTRPPNQTNPSNAANRSRSTSCDWYASSRVLLGAGDAVAERPALIAVDGSRIAAIEEPADDASYRRRLAELLAGEDNLIDWGDHLVTPAFVNPHTHLALGFLRAFDFASATRSNLVEDVFFRVEGALTAADVLAFTRVGALESLSSGVGLVWDHYYHADAVADGLRQAGLCGVVAPTLQDLSGPAADDPETALALTRQIHTDERLREAGIVAAVGPHATDTVSGPLFMKAAELAQSLDIPLHAHLAQSPEEADRIRERHGKGCADWLADLGVLTAVPAAAWAHGIFLRDSELAYFDERHTLIVCPYSQLVFGFPARMGRWERAGVRWAVATDCASNNDSMNVQQELRFVAAQRTVGASYSGAYERFLTSPTPVSAMPAWAARTELFDRNAAMSAPAALLSRIWSVPGSMHRLALAGEIATGHLANLIAWDLSHPCAWPAHRALPTLAMADVAPAIWQMVVAGRAVSEPGDHHRKLAQGDAARTYREEATARLSELMSRIAWAPV